MVRILVLDDMPARHEGFRSILEPIGHTVVSAWTVTEFVAILEREDPFHMICFDHDLADADPINADRDYGAGPYGGMRHLTGEDAAYALIQRPHKKPNAILVHSWNEPGAQRIKSLLEKAFPGIQIRRRAFGG